MNEPFTTEFEASPSDFPWQREMQQALLSALDISKWSSGLDMQEVYKRILHTISASTANESKAVKVLRAEILPRFLENKAPLPPDLAFGRFSAEQIEKAHLGLLFNGATEACDGTIASHSTLPVTISQIGVCLVSYLGEQGAYAHRLFRKDLDIKGEEPLEVMRFMENRRLSSHDDNEESVPQNNLTLLGLMAYAERAVLLEKSTAPWRLGHGNPFPLQLLTGFWTGSVEVARLTFNLCRRIVEHGRFVFTVSEPRERELLTLGYALKPYEYMVYETVSGRMRYMLREGGSRRSEIQKVQTDFLDECGDEFVQGLFCTSEYSPPRVFYAHRKHVQTAALLAIADSVLQEHRGFPLLIDIADNICRSTFSAETFLAGIRNAYAESGQPFRYLGERETRRM